MILLKILRFFHLLAFLLITSQLAYYLFVMADALKLVRIDNFVEQRKIVDPLVHLRHVPTYYVCLGLSIIIIFLMLKNWKTPQFFFTSFAVLCLFADVVLAQSLNAPINSAINDHLFGDSIVDWNALRRKWLSAIKLRAAISLAGFVGLLTGIFWFKG